MTVFHCARCGAALTPELRRLAHVPEVSVHGEDRDRGTGLAPSTVRRGSYAVDPEPWGAPFVVPEAGTAAGGGEGALLMPPGMAGMVSAGPRDSVIVHPRDVPGLRLTGDLGPHHGAAAPLRTGGRNLACGCGALVATLAADCVGPYELHLDPLRVYAAAPGG
ncbi:hypothetical protein AB0K92_06310 [Streptomyces sp. NPDC052687]|uniref:hypothetical protein n=1 Tax=Streptomyces sp. NPDC052687 TaxID=3154759 RepID=UPI00341C6D24